MTAAIAPNPERAFENLEALLARIAPRLLRLATRYTRDPDASADVVQNALEKIVRHQGQFRGHARPTTWIHRIVVNEALMWLRSDRRRTRHSAPLDPLTEPAIPDCSPSPLDQLLATERESRVRRAMRELSADERELLERCVMHDEDYASYGSLLGVRASAVKSRAYRARRRLAERLGAGAG